jgi:hypothetical protein
MKKIALLLVSIYSVCNVNVHGQNGSDFDGFYPPVFEADYSKVYPANFIQLIGEIDTTESHGLSFVTKTLALNGDASEVAYVIQDNQCGMFRTFEGVFKGTLFKYEHSKFVLTENLNQERFAVIIDPVNFEELFYEVGDLHDFDIQSNGDFWSFQEVGDLSHVAVKRNVLNPEVNLLIQDTVDFNLGSYLATHYWIDFGQDSEDYRHPNGLSFKDGWLAISSRHLNELSVENVSNGGPALRLRPYHDPNNDFTWTNNQEGLYGLHDPEIVSVSGNIIMVTAWDNGNFRSWNGSSLLTLYEDIDEDGTIDTVIVPELFAPSFSRGVLIKINTQDMTAEVVESFIPNGAFYGGAMGGFKLVGDSIYSFSYGMTAGEYPYSPFVSLDPDEDRPQFGAVNRNTGEKVFSGFYPGGTVYQFQTTLKDSLVSQPRASCEDLGNGTYRLSAPENYGEIQWSNGEISSEITVQENGDYLFWQTDETYNLVSKPITPGPGCLTTSVLAAEIETFSIPRLLSNELLQKYVSDYNLDVYDIQGRGVSLDQVTVGSYVLLSEQKTYRKIHIVL